MLAGRQRTKTHCRQSFHWQPYRMHEKCEGFISLKDHKENFENNPKCRLLNPAKSDSGKLRLIYTVPD